LIEAVFRMPRALLRASLVGPALLCAKQSRSSASRTLTAWTCPLTTAPDGSIRQFHSTPSHGQNAQPAAHVSDAAEAGDTQLVIDEWGAVSSIHKDRVDSFVAERQRPQYVNQDGRRFDDGRYRCDKQGIHVLRLLSSALKSSSITMYLAVRAVHFL
jgi:hypothetical protein